MTTPPVPFAAELLPALSSMPQPDGPPMTPETVPFMREAMNAMVPGPGDVIAGRPVRFEERTIPGPDGAPDLPITIFSPAVTGPATAGLYNIHGGGMMMGHRYMDNERLIALVAELGVVAVNVDYRLAPEHPHPAPVEDCYAGLAWFSAHAAELGVDPERIVIMGGSAGGGLSAGVSLLARDRHGPKLAGQLLLCPMIDNTNTTASSYQYAGLGTWTREANLVGWTCLLGEELAFSEAASPYAAPSRATDLAGLPPAFIEAGTAETFRDEDVEYASRIWAAGGQAELHLWSGGFHGFDMFAPESEIARAALATRTSWLRRTLGL